MNPLQTFFVEDELARQKFNELAETLARTQNRGFDEVYLDLMQMFNAFCVYVIEEEP